MQRHIVVLTGAGISAESGLSTFRDNGGLWEQHSVYDVATPEAFERNRDLVIPVNAAIRNLDGVQWLDLYSRMVDEQGLQSKELFKDQVHPNAEGYRVWHDSLTAMMKKDGLL